MRSGKTETWSKGVEMLGICYIRITAATHGSGVNAEDTRCWYSIDLYSRRWDDTPQVHSRILVR